MDSGVNVIATTGEPAPKRARLDGQGAPVVWFDGSRPGFVNAGGAPPFHVGSVSTSAYDSAHVNSHGGGETPRPNGAGVFRLMPITSSCGLMTPVTPTMPASMPKVQQTQTSVRASSAGAMPAPAVAAPPLQSMAIEYGVYLEGVEPGQLPEPLTPEPLVTRMATIVPLVVNKSHRHEMSSSSVVVAVTPGSVAASSITPVMSTVPVLLTPTSDEPEVDVLYEPTPSSIGLVRRRTGSGPLPLLAERTAPSPPPPPLLLPPPPPPSFVFSPTHAGAVESCPAPLLPTSVAELVAALVTTPTEQRLADRAVSEVATPLPRTSEHDLVITPPPPPSQQQLQQQSQPLGAMQQRSRSRRRPARQVPLPEEPAPSAAVVSLSQITTMLQCKMSAAPVEPPLPAQLGDLKDFSRYPLLAIGDAFQLALRPRCPVSLYLTQGTRAQAFGQVSCGICVTGDLVTESTRALLARLSGLAESQVAGVVLGFQIFFVDPDTCASCCLRCAKPLGACQCSYPSDLLELCGQRIGGGLSGCGSSETGQLTAQLRIPRARRKLSKEEQERGMVLSELRPSNWNGHLRVHTSQVKAVMVRVVELVIPQPGMPLAPVALSRHQLVARLVGKSYTFPVARLLDLLQLPTDGNRGDGDDQGGEQQSSFGHLSPASLEHLTPAEADHFMTGLIDSPSMLIDTNVF